MQIYKIINLVNKKIYIGKNKNNDINYFGSGYLIRNAIKKYGKENFKKEILEHCQNIEEMNIKEKYWIKKLNSHISEGGYNLTYGGDGGDTFTNNQHKDETRKKLSNVHKGKPKSEEHKQHLSESKIGELNPTKRDDVKNILSANHHNVKGELNPMFGTSRTRDSLEELESKGIQLKGDHYEYMRKKIKCTDIITNEVIIYDGLKELRDALKISKNKYYTSIKTNIPYKQTYLFELIS